MQVAHGRRTIETVSLVAPHLSLADEVAALEGVEAHTTEGVYEIPGARELLERLPRDAWAIVTSGVRAVATLRITHTGLPMPRALVCADEIHRGKPDPEGYLTAAARLGRAPADCVVIEDSRNGLLAATAAGMKCVITVNALTEREDFSEAALVVSSLGDPGGEPARVIANRSAAHPDGAVTVADLDAIVAGVKA